MQFLACFGLAVVLTPAVRRVGLALGLVDHPGDALKIHSKPVPVLGGFAVAASMFGGLVILREFIPVSIVIAVAIALATGLLDDTRPIPPWVRLLLQAVAGVVLVAGGLRLEALGFLGPGAAVLIVMLCANAVNMIDGQDALAGGLSAIAAMALFVLGAWAGVSQAAGLSLALGGSLIGFTIWNRPPARIFLGNGGAYAVGVLLAFIALVIIEQTGWRGVLATGMCLAVFAFEIVFTVARRLLSGSPIVPGDRFHSFDLLAADGGDRARITVMFWGFGSLAGALGLLIGRLPLVPGIIAAAVGAGAAVAAGAHLYSRLLRMLRQA
jgi:UDP-GlcNAc:undecaprenyl-phosphate GlcNAc-1-phosphate transferase